MTTAPRFTAKTLLSQSLITGIALSPDGATLVYARKTIEKAKYRSLLHPVIRSYVQKNMNALRSRLDEAPT